MFGCLYDSTLSLPLCGIVLLFSHGASESDDLFKLSAQSETSMPVVDAISTIKFENDVTARKFAYVCTMHSECTERGNVKTGEAS